MGGSDDAFNLIELTVEEHAKAHRLLWEEHGQWEDEVAWKALSGQIKMSEASKIAIELGASKGGQIAKKTGQIKEAQKKAVQKLKTTNYKHIQELGKTQGKINWENGHLSKICNKELRRLGGINATKVSNRKIISFLV